jgi:hypothetical protein
MWSATEDDETHRSLHLRHGVIDSVHPTKAAGYADVSQPTRMSQRWNSPIIAGIIVETAASDI